MKTPNFLDSRWNATWNVPSSSAWGFHNIKGWSCYNSPALQPGRLWHVRAWHHQPLFHPGLSGQFPDAFVSPGTLSSTRSSAIHRTRWGPTGQIQTAQTSYFLPLLCLSLPLTVFLSIFWLRRKNQKISGVLGRQDSTLVLQLLKIRALLLCLPYSVLIWTCSFMELPLCLQFSAMIYLEWRPINKIAT